MAALQRKLLALGYDIDPDGFYGPASVAVIQAFQAAHRLPADGVWRQRDEEVLASSYQSVAGAMPAGVVLNLAEQQIYIYNAQGQVISVAPVSSGGPGNETPTGTYNVFARQRVGTAHDEDVHMDYFTVFNGNIGFHGIPWVTSRDNRIPTPLGEYPVSHGCVRLNDDVAQWLYTFLPDGAPVTVV